VYECHTNSVDELKQRLIDIWHSLQQNVIDTAVNESRKRLIACVQMDDILPARSSARVIAIIMCLSVCVSHAVLYQNG